MDQCIKVEWELEKVLQNFTGYGHAGCLCRMAKRCMTAHIHPILWFWDTIGCEQQGCFLSPIEACSASHQVPSEDIWKSITEIEASASRSAH
uniref:Uncharacterized protein n=1 Tax=Amazona collaria TaxID=241587 RepID=A0A8B9J2I8_9PSIT